MSIQSPKSKRSHGPGESPADYGGRETRSGGNKPEHKASSLARSAEKVPNKSSTGGHDGAGKGVMSGYSSAPVHSPTPSQAGGAGYAESSEAKKKGGSTHQFPRGSE